jgi:hypothetical protein
LLWGYFHLEMGQHFVNHNVSCKHLKILIVADGTRGLFFNPFIILAGSFQEQ